MRISLLRYTAIGMTTLGMAGMAAASSISFEATGPDSFQQSDIHKLQSLVRTNVNNIGLTNSNTQSAMTGKVSVAGNTSVSGPVVSGMAHNAHSTDTTVQVFNDSPNNAWFSPSDPSDEQVGMDLTGPNSTNKANITNNKMVTLTNSNNVGISNTNKQNASSGPVVVSGNTLVGPGGVFSGDATNSSTTTTAVGVQN